jgi:hypothetical protein
MFTLILIKAKTRVMLNMESTMNIVGYIKVSTLTHTREVESLEAQSRQVTNYAASKGLVLPDENVFVEAGVSGSTEFQERPEGSRLFATLQLGDLVIFPKLNCYLTIGNTESPSKGSCESFRSACPC